MSKNRRNFLKTFATGLLSFPFLKGVRANYRPRIVIIGGGFGGGTCVKYLEKYNLDSYQNKQYRLGNFHCYILLNLWQLCNNIQLLNLYYYTDIDVEK